MNYEPPVLHSQTKEDQPTSPRTVPTPTEPNRTYPNRKYFWSTGAPSSTDEVSARPPTIAPSEGGLASPKSDAGGSTPVKPQSRLQSNQKIRPVKPGQGWSRIKFF